MARLLKRKRIPILSGDAGDYDPDVYVDVPVIAEFELIGSRGQEFRYRFLNDSRSQLRITHVKKVGNVTGSFDSETATQTTTDNYVSAERIEVMPFNGNLDGGQAWVTYKKLKNLDPAPKQPDGSNDPKHLQVHYVRFYKNNDVDEYNWIDFEYIDLINFLGSLAQEYFFRLRHPTAEDYAAIGGDSKFGQKITDDDPYQPIIGWCDTSLELLDVEKDEETGKPLSARLDPFQNVVNCNALRNAHFCAIEYDSGKMWSSADGKNWISYMGPFNAGAVQVGYGNGMWILTGEAYQSDEVSPTSYSIKSTDLFNWETVYAEGPTGGTQDAAVYDVTTNKFKIHRRGYYGDTGGGTDIFVDNPFPLNENGTVKFGKPEVCVRVFKPENSDIPDSIIHPTLINNNRWVQMRGPSNNEIWYSNDKGKTWEREVATTFATCADPWGFTTEPFGQEPGTKFPRDENGVPITGPGSAPTVTTPLIPVGDFHYRNDFPPSKFEVSYFTGGFDAGTGQSGGAIHVLMWGLTYDPSNPIHSSQYNDMIRRIMDPAAVDILGNRVWGRIYSGSPSGGNYIEFCGDGSTYGSGSDTANQTMIEQCLAGFVNAVAQFPTGWVYEFRAGDPIDEDAYNYPSLTGYFPLG